MGLEVNFDSAIRRIEELNNVVEDDIKEKGLKAGAEVILQELRQEVARNVYDTGALYNSLDMYKVSHGRGNSVSVLIGPNTSDKDIIARNYYQHYGNSSMAGKKHLSVAFQRGYNNALEETIREILSLLRRG